MRRFTTGEKAITAERSGECGGLGRDVLRICQRPSSPLFRLHILGSYPAHFEILRLDKLGILTPKSIRFFKKILFRLQRTLNGIFFLIVIYIALKCSNYNVDVLLVSIGTTRQDGAVVINICNLTLLMRPKVAAILRQVQRLVKLCSQDLDHSLKIIEPLTAMCVHPT